MWTVVGYADDSEERTAGRLLQGNLIGPAGLISMEDGMIGALIQNAIEGDKDKCSVLEMDGRGVEQITGTRVSEAGVRGFWTGYRELMGV
jgi:anthranilate 1,2-dioxygenase large subunit/terephthalate 1,2-dioxygenase oxygenase component alpha subunit